MSRCQDEFCIMTPTLKVDDSKERAIVHYLNAYKLLIRDENYLSKKEYQVELNASLIPNVPFVNNRYWIAEFLKDREAKKYYREALDNVQKIFSEEDLPVEYYLEPQSFINEFIVGTHITRERYNEIYKKANL